MKRFILIILIFFLLICQKDLYAYWVWSPKTNQWINPVYKVFDTPEEQFNWAMGYFDEQDYKKAISEFKKLVNKFPKAEYAAEATYYIAASYEKLKNYYKAFKTYQSVIVTYPLTGRMEEIAERQYLIAEILFNKKKFEQAAEIFSKTLANAPYSKVSDVAQYKAGLCYLKLRSFSEARDEFAKVIENYGFSPYVDDADFQSGFCSFKISSVIKDYDEELLTKAIEDLDYFLRKYPTSEYVPEAESLLNKLNHEKAKKLFSTARFYEKQNKDFAALKYYETLLYTYEKDELAQKARVKVEKLRAQ